MPDRLSFPVRLSLSPSLRVLSRLSFPVHLSHTHLSLALLLSLLLLLLLSLSLSLSLPLSFSVCTQLPIILSCALALSLPACMLRARSLCTIHPCHEHSYDYTYYECPYSRAACA